MVQWFPQELIHGAEPDVIRRRDPLERFDLLFAGGEDEDFKRALGKQIVIPARLFKRDVFLKFLAQNYRPFGVPINLDKKSAAVELNPAIGNVPEVNRLLP